MLQNGESDVWDESEVVARAANPRYFHILVFFSHIVVTALVFTFSVYFSYRLILTYIFRIFLFSWAVI